MDMLSWIHFTLGMPNNTMHITRWRISEALVNPHYLGGTLAETHGCGGHTTGLVPFFMCISTSILLVRPNPSTTWQYAETMVFRRGDAGNDRGSGIGLRSVGCEGQPGVEITFDAGASQQVVFAVFSSSDASQYRP